jgi:transposase-like protein
MEDATGRSHSREFKLAAIARMEAGENVSALSRELGVKRTLLYRWREQYRLGGEARLRGRRGRPPRAEAAAITAARVAAGEGAELVKAHQRIAELERKVGQQQVDLDFFQQALRHFEGSRRADSAPGGTASSPSSKR